MHKIIHIDMDAFFASVEQRDCPQYRGKPLIVGGDPDGRGVVAAASYEARQFGIRSAMSCRDAKKRCPDAIFVRPRFEAYRAVSQQILSLMYAITPLVEPLSLDEAYLDVSEVWQAYGSATALANELRAKIYQQTGLTASAGVSHTKMLAKIASDLNKPNGITVIMPEHAQSLIDSLPIEKFHGIGHASSEKLHAIGVHTGRQLRLTPLETLVQLFGNKRGKFYHDIAHGIDTRQVKAERVRKSVGTEITFGENIYRDDILLAKLQEQTRQAFGRLSDRNLQAHTITLKVRYADFSQITRSHSLKSPYQSADDAYKWLSELFRQIPRTQPIRLVGVTFSNLQSQQQSTQLLLDGL
ncbi:DNA polymerase IV [Moraxella cuniculi]|uniref:DNA polymerase IV n=1 Tax=Moraxella cuniculi TaxID=34061 RepID=A0A3S4UM18_9GAMM|nr:DNA polymerase IV [Moraxella cuniculi]VEG13912.1 DNA polymerase IV [Moraxella cuniculi]